jgi:hypothetical protein
MSSPTATRTWSSVAQIPLAVSKRPAEAADEAFSPGMAGLLLDNAVGART